MKSNTSLLIAAAFLSLTAGFSTAALAQDVSSPNQQLQIPGLACDIIDIKNPVDSRENSKQGAIITRAYIVGKVDGPRPLTSVTATLPAKNPGDVNIKAQLGYNQGRREIIISVSRNGVTLTKTGENTAKFDDVIAPNGSEQLLVNCASSN